MRICGLDEDAGMKGSDEKLILEIVKQLFDDCQILLGSGPPPTASTANRGIDAKAGDFLKLTRGT